MAAGPGYTSIFNSLGYDTTTLLKGDGSCRYRTQNAFGCCTLQDQNNISNPPQEHRHRMIVKKKLITLFIFFLYLKLFLLYFYIIFSKNILRLCLVATLGLRNFFFFYFKIIFSPCFCINFVLFFCEKYILRLYFKKLLFFILN
jgi:hypothetical protein